MFSVGLLLHGCGYGFVRSEFDCTVGGIEDETGEGDLGLWAQHRLSARLVPSNRCELFGNLRVVEEAPAGLKNGGVGAYRVRVQLDLRIKRQASEVRRILCDGSSGYAQSSDLAHVQTSRRASLEAAVNDAIERSLLRLQE